MPVRRTYACTACTKQWTQTHALSTDPYPDCPHCGEPSGWVPQPFAIKTNKSRAIDVAQDMMEERGFTDIRDNQRVGDIAAVGPPPIQTAESEAITRSLLEQAQLSGVQAEAIAPHLKAQAENFWQGGSPNMGVAPAGPSIAAAASAEARNLGADPIALLHEAGKRGELNLLSPERLNVVSAAKGA